MHQYAASWTAMSPRKNNIKSCLVIFKRFFHSETRYIARSSSSAEEDDVLVTVWSPLLSTQPPLLHILNPTTLGLIAELEIPVSFLPVGVHGMFYQFEK